MNKKTIAKIAAANGRFSKALSRMKDTIGDFGELTRRYFIVFDILRKMYDMGYADGLKAGKKK